jgi:hypothetical protein
LLRVELLQLLIKLLCFTVLLLQLFDVLLLHSFQNLLLLQVLGELLSINLKKQK